MYKRQRLHHSADGHPAARQLLSLGRSCAGEWIPGLYGVGLGFADAEHTSGAPYAEAGFMPFALRARDIAESVGRQR